MQTELILFIFLFFLSRFVFLSESEPLNTRRWMIKSAADLIVIGGLFGMTDHTLMLLIISIGTSLVI